MQIFCPEHVQQLAADPQVVAPQTCPVPPPVPPLPGLPPVPPLPEQVPQPAELTLPTHTLSQDVEQQ